MTAAQCSVNPEKVAGRDMGRCNGDYKAEDQRQRRQQVFWLRLHIKIHIPHSEMGLRCNSVDDLKLRMTVAENQLKRVVAGRWNLGQQELAILQERTRSNYGKISSTTPAPTKFEEDINHTACKAKAKMVARIKEVLQAPSEDTESNAWHKFQRRF